MRQLRRSSLGQPLPVLVLFGGLLPSVALFKLIISEPEQAAGEHLFPVTVVFEGARLALQLVNDVPVIDEAPVFPAQARQRVHALLSIVEIQMLGMKVRLHGFSLNLFSTE